MLSGSGWQASVFLGSALGHTSPVRTATPLLGAEVLLEPGTTLVLDVDETFEHGLLVDSGSIVVDGQPVKPAELAFVEPGRASLRVEAIEASRLVLLGGPPFGEQLVMWWNFVGRTHDDVVQAREEWQAQISRDGAVVDDGQDVADGRFGVVYGDHLAPIPAPPMPTARLQAERLDEGRLRWFRDGTSSLLNQRCGLSDVPGTMPPCPDRWSATTAWRAARGRRATPSTATTTTPSGGCPSRARLPTWRGWTLEAFQSGLSWLTILKQAPCLPRGVRRLRRRRGRGLRRLRPASA